MVFSKTEGYFHAKDKSFYMYGIELSEKRMNDRVALDGDSVGKLIGIFNERTAFLSFCPSPFVTMNNKIVIG